MGQCHQGRPHWRGYLSRDLHRWHSEPYGYQEEFHTLGRANMNTKPGAHLAYSHTSKKARMAGVPGKRILEEWGQKRHQGRSPWTTTRLGYSSEAEIIRVLWLKMSLLCTKKKFTWVASITTHEDQVRNKCKMQDKNQGLDWVEMWSRWWDASFWRYPPHKTCHLTRVYRS